MPDEKDDDKRDLNLTSLGRLFHIAAYAEDLVDAVADQKPLGHILRRLCVHLSELQETEDIDEEDAIAHYSDCGDAFLLGTWTEAVMTSSTELILTKEKK